MTRPHSHWSRKLIQISALTIIGFFVPVAMLLPVEYAFSEFGTQPDWRIALERYLPPAIGSSLLFLASAITSSTPRKVVTFVQAMFLNFFTLLVCVAAFVPTQHAKSTAPEPSVWAYIPLIAVLCVFVALLVFGNIPSAAASKAGER
jgi:hypothetical protein